MALATSAAESTLIWEQPTTSQLMEQRCGIVSGSLTWYKCTHYSARARFLFLTKAAANTLVGQLNDPTHTTAIVAKNDSFSEFPCTESTVSIGPTGVTNSTVSKWTARAVLRSDGIGYDVEVCIDYDKTEALS